MEKHRPIIEIENIEISPERLAEYQERLKGHPRSPIQISNKGRIALAKEFLDGACSICAEPPSKIVKYDAGAGAKVLERYCQSCFEKQDFEKQELNKEIKLLDTGQRNETIAIKMEDWKRNNKY